MISRNILYIYAFIANVVLAIVMSAFHFDDWDGLLMKSAVEQGSFDFLSGMYDTGPQFFTQFPIKFYIYIYGLGGDLLYSIFRFFIYFSYSLLIVKLIYTYELNLYKLPAADKIILSVLCIWPFGFLGIYSVHFFIHLFIILGIMGVFLFSRDNYIYIIFGSIAIIIATQYHHSLVLMVIVPYLFLIKNRMRNVRLIFSILITVSIYFIYKNIFTFYPDETIFDKLEYTNINLKDIKKSCANIIIFVSPVFITSYIMRYIGHNNVKYIIFSAILALSFAISVLYTETNLNSYIEYEIVFISIVLAAFILIHYTMYVDIVNKNWADITAYIAIILLLLPIILSDRYAQSYILIPLSNFVIPTGGYSSWHNLRYSYIIYILHVLFIIYGYFKYGYRAKSILGLGLIAFVSLQGLGWYNSYVKERTKYAIYTEFLKSEKYRGDQCRIRDLGIGFEAEISTYALSALAQKAGNDKQLVYCNAKKCSENIQKYACESDTIAKNLLIRDINCADIKPFEELPFCF